MKISDYGRGIVIRSIYYAWPLDAEELCVDAQRLNDASEYCVVIFHHGAQISAEHIKGKVIKHKNFFRITIRNTLKLWSATNEDF